MLDPTVDLRAWYLQHNNRSCCESLSLKAGNDDVSWSKRFMKRLKQTFIAWFHDRCVNSMLAPASKKSWTLRSATEKIQHFWREYHRHKVQNCDQNRRETKAATKFLGSDRWWRAGTEVDGSIGSMGYNLTILNLLISGVYSGEINPLIRSPWIHPLLSGKDPSMTGWRLAQW